MSNDNFVTIAVENRHLPSEVAIVVEGHYTRIELPWWPKTAKEYTKTAKQMILALHHNPRTATDRQSV